MLSAGRASPNGSYDAGATRITFAVGRRRLRARFPELPFAVACASPRLARCNVTPVRRRLLGAGVLLGATTALVLLVVSMRDPRTSSDPVASFLEAWRRWRSSELVLTAEYERSSERARLATTHKLVQRPPEYLRIQANSLEGVVSGETIRCDRLPDNDVVCSPPTPARDEWRRRVDDELASWAEILRRRRLYEVTDEGGCFHLFLTDASFPSPPEGERATYCFDEETGALLRYRQVWPGVEIRWRAASVRPRVRAEDFRLPHDVSEALRRSRRATERQPR
ncbi:MAG: hypothetical protein KatS3mg008_1444 [Acidimicrobiales bacterium]|nr:MAG: hypothetical protein KatS3mg008_1444 [Acidimicrobiales bacterium]